MNQFAPAEPLAERLTHMLVAMATELATTRERVDTLEKMLGKAGVIDAQAVDDFVLDDAEEQSRKERREQFLDRIFEHLQAEITAAQQANASSNVQSNVQSNAQSSGIAQ